MDYTIDKANSSEIQDMQVEDRIARYLRGEMNAEEVVSFERELETNRELRSKAIAMARLIKSMKEVGLQQDQTVIDAFASADEESVKMAAKKATQENNKKTKAKSLSFYIRSFSAAASVVLLIGIGMYYYDYHKTVSLGEQYAMAFADEQMSFRGAASPEVEKELSELFENVQKGENLDATTHRLSVLWELSTMDIYNDYTDYAPYIGWNLAIGHLKNNDKKNALDILTQMNSLNSTEETIVRDKVLILLKELR